MELKAIFTVIHFIGVFVGLWGAVMTDTAYLRAVKRGTLDEKNVKGISESSLVVWIGIIIIILSGLALLSLDPARYLASTKFQAKMTIVAVLLINGIVFHKKHLPLLRSQVGKNLPASEEFKKKSAGLYLAGAVSVASWISAFILGALRSVSYPYWAVMLAYLLVLVVAILFSQFSRKRFLRNNGSRTKSLS